VKKDQLQQPTTTTPASTESKPQQETTPTKKTPEKRNSDEKENSVQSSNTPTSSAVDAKQKQKGASYWYTTTINKVPTAMKDPGKINFPGKSWRKCKS